jgi:lysozyme family protein
MANDFAKYRRGYANLWRRAELKPESKQRTLTTARAITPPPAMQHYNTAAAQSGVPAGLIAALHYREGGGSFDTYLGNGDPLDRRTTHVPRGRGPFPTWELGAADALRDTPRPADGKWTIEFALYFAELFNGRGYFGKGENSPYVWAETTLEQRGMYVADGQFDPTIDDPRPGVAALFKAFQSVRPELSLPAIDGTTEASMAPSPQAPASNPFPAILKGLELAKSFAPFVANFLPQPTRSIVQIAMVVADDLATFIEAANKDGLDQGDVAAFLDNLAGHFKTAAATLRPPQT